MPSGDVLVLIDEGGRVVEWGRPAEELLGWSAEEAVGRSVTALMSEAAADGERKSDRFSDAAAVLVKPVLQGTSVMWHVLAAGDALSGQDVAILKAVFAHSPVGLHVLDSQLRVVRMSTATGGLHDAPVGHLLGKHFTEACELADPEEEAAVAQRVLESGVPVVNRIVRHIKAPGQPTRRIHSVSYFRLEDSHGDVVGLVASTVDVTERENAQNRLALLDAVRTRVGHRLSVMDVCRELVRRVHPDDRKALGRLVRSTAARSPWISLRFRTENEGWHHMACQTRRIQLGYGGPEQVFGVIRDETQLEAHRQKALATLAAERQRADEIADFSAALITAASEQELRQVVLTRVAATFGGTGAVLTLLDDETGLLRASSDAGVDPRQSDSMEGLSLDDPQPLPYAIRTGTPQFIPNHEELIRDWPQAVGIPYLDSFIAISITPLSPVGDQPLGAWAVTYDSEHHSPPDERALMSTLADLAGQALKRIRLQQARVELATALQQHMLPTLPDHLPGLEVAARYQPSRDGLDIGGD
ncbi:PAS domain-containing protein [Streptomyces sp. NRRL S-1824]|uniref:PAS domain-containing protein n=1 Tax=Streptomyces sp. NRRL S-1824 TaxID=1463889 RepID=UPI00068BF122|nr:PAS domain-containing protein [Streptomyces sp. NRRL S-1824]